jgi:acetyl esterase/lipase
LKNYNETLADWYAQGNVLTPQIARESLATLTRTFVTDGPELSLVLDDAVDSTTTSVPVRIYHPDRYISLEVAVFFHGGGHLAGSVEVYDPICRKIAYSTRRIVVSVDYRLAPEHPYPAGLDDGVSVLDGCLGMFDRLGLNYLPRVALVGDSAGGAMSATLAHRYQTDPGLDIDKLVLIYPSLDYTLSSPSIDLLGTGYLLETNKIQWYFDQYFTNNEDLRAVSPLFMDIKDHFPQTLVVTAGFCPLSDEGSRYVSRLQEHGVSVHHLHIEEMVHAFLNLENLVPQSCEQCYGEIGSFLGDPEVA